MEAQRAASHNLDQPDRLIGVRTGRRITWALALIAAIVVPACSRTSAPREPSHPTGPELVVRMETSGGLVPPSTRYRELPAFTLVGDGRAIEPGPQIEIYPPPALPSVVQRTVSEDGIAFILRAAVDAGLTKGDRTVALPPGVGVADAGETVFTVVADGKTSVTRVDSLGTIDETGERKKILEFRAVLIDLEGKLPTGSTSKDSQYDVVGLRVVVTPYSASPDPNLKQAVQAWPLAQPLATFGKPIDQMARCAVVEGADLDRLLPKLSATNELTPWQSEGTNHLLIVRPLMPDESTC